MSAEDRSADTNGGESALCFHDIDELDGRAGYHPGPGYVDAGEAADEILGGVPSCGSGDGISSAAAGTAARSTSLGPPAIGTFILQWTIGEDASRLVRA
jgi:hypothetical protein